MTARSIRTATALSLATALCVACSAAPPSAENRESDQAALKPDLPVTRNPPAQVIGCGGPGQFGDSTFEQTLAANECSPPVMAFLYADSTASEFVTMCPIKNIGPLLLLIHEYQDVAPWYAENRQPGAGTTCSSFQTPSPRDEFEISYDPDCSGANCGKLRPAL